MIFSERKLLNLLFLAKALTPHYKHKLKLILREALRHDFDEPTILASIEPMYDRDLISQITIHTSISEFVQQYPAFESLAAQIDQDNLSESLDKLLKDITPSPKFQQGFVNVMSIHKSKGLQAETVFVNGLVDGVLPNKARGVDTMEAQRRLLFVGMTRALRSLYLLSPVEWDGKYVNKLDKSQFNYAFKKKKWNGKASTFVVEMMQTGTT